MFAVEVYSSQIMKSYSFTEICIITLSLREYTGI
jgi:hypothetical protein